MTLNLAFAFRGHSFVGLNSYDLEPKERASVGGVVLYYGGGLQDGTVAWVEDMLNRFAPEEGRQQILFTHHEPRAATPGKASYRQQNYGRYDAIDTLVSYLTLGHFGLGNSPKTGLYLVFGDGPFRAFVYGSAALLLAFGATMTALAFRTYRRTGTRSAGGRSAGCSMAPSSRWPCSCSGTSRS